MAKALATLNLTTTHVPSKRNHSRPSLSYSYRPTILTMSYKKSHWASVHEDVEAHLKQAIVVKEPVEVFEPMRHLIFAAPVNMAPPLCMAACELVGGHRDQATAAAAALHVMHAASYVHENLPLSSRPSLVPKSKPLMYHGFNPNIELLIGDAMIPFGLELLGNSDNPAQDKSDRILRVMVEITRAMGSEGVIDGQYNEVLQYKNSSESESKNGKEMKNRTYEKKAGVLHACGAACGAILGGGSEEEIERLRRYGYYVGMVQRLRSNSKEEQVEEVKKMAVKEIEGFNEAKVEAMNSTFFPFRF